MSFLKTKVNNEYIKKLNTGNFYLCDKKTSEIIEPTVDTSQANYVSPKSFFIKYMQTIPNFHRMFEDNPSFLFYFLDIVNDMQWDNSVVFSLPGKSNKTIERFRSFLSRKGIIKKSKGKWYVNPAFCLKSKDIDVSLLALFAKENKDFYGITSI